MHYPELVHRLPILASPTRAQRVEGKTWMGYVIPGTSDLESIANGESHGQSEAASRTCVVLFAHGGGYARGEARMYLRYMERWIRFAREKKGMDLVFVTIEYPLTTEAAHPAQLESMLGAYRYLLDLGISPSRIVFMGDSAGGGLMVLTGLKLLELGLPQPAGSVLVSPWLDLALDAFRGGNASVETDYVVTGNTILPLFTDMFLRGTGLKGSDAEINPLRRKPSELKGLHRQLIFVGSAEVVTQEGKRWADVCEAADIEHKLVIEPGQLHVYAMGSSWIDPGVRNKTDDIIVDWIWDCCFRGVSNSARTVGTVGLNA
ncbi:hypothetical protein Z517_08388 [Fonsecaea pedrosoi CBS 271.37]|uniref:Alpha/beta hydrolase fold-3 domain-containing protein n=1 Tax=Fonsecaea pedrosoi CBS 271.37 TaxID=1442368 RepID=A0A0D2GJ62_9EURO|nr:uncharacterized protein Z517_08388 [Fonsecaea pedrosoi CBS 271.37]KIW78550.1 hypothetical protein Z517_08388 [Fonsecaea pedrosoi CBS 271.37]